jgi:hypothetical protein
VHAQTAPDAAELTRLLNEFLAGASRNDVAIHDRFWAEELVYTGSGGRRRNKAEVMKDVRSAPAPKASDPVTTYTGEDIQIQQYGNSAIVAFRLVGTTVRDGVTTVANFLNTGTFIKRNGKWQVVAWQATRLPRSEEDNQKEVAMAEAAFHKAMLDADVKKLASLTDGTFVMTRTNGQQISQKQLLDFLGSGQLKYAKLETKDTRINLYGDTAVARGMSLRQHSSMPGAPTGDPAPLETFYTLTFVNQGGGWKAVALHLSRL